MSEAIVINTYPLHQLQHPVCLASAERVDSKLTDFDTAESPSGVLHIMCDRT